MFRRNIRWVEKHPPKNTPLQRSGKMQGHHAIQFAMVEMG
jgi:hypothetical protein